MSKSIYDEVLDILADSLQDPLVEENECYILSYNQMNKVYNTIFQAQKQEKLLELYKELTTLSKSYIKIKEIQEKIKELENE